MSELGEDVTPPPTEPERNRRTLLAGTIERRQQDIERRWVQRVQEEASGRSSTIPPTNLRDGIHEYLRRMAEALRGEDSLEASGTAAWAEVAREHSLTRLGFDIDQLVREFILLRRVLFEVAREEDLVSSDIHTERLADLIDAAIARAVNSYIESRDIAARRQQAEHIGFLTHELRNPLGAATMAAALLRKKSEIASAGGEVLDVLDRSLQRIRSQIDAILLTQRLDADEMECQSVDVRLDKVMDEATRAAKFEAKQKGISFGIRYDPEIQLHVDPGLATSALQNVIDNAVKFTDHGRVDVVVEDKVSEILIHIYDNCDGLSAEEFGTIFEPFKRAHSGKAGTGLGLAIARRAVEAQGGRIGAESSGEGGCHFWLSLPKPRQ
jgi:signal transduction histidine kinase